MLSPPSLLETALAGEVDRRRQVCREVPAHGPGRCPHTPWVLVCVTECLLLLGLGLGQANARIELLKQPCHFESFLSFEQLSPLLFWGPGHRGEDIRNCQWSPLAKQAGRCRPTVSLSYLKRVVFALRRCWGGGLVPTLSPLTAVSSPCPSGPQPGPALLGAAACTCGGRYSPTTNAGSPPHAPGSRWRGGFTFPPLSSGSPARWREQCSGDGEPVGQGSPCVRTAGAVCV